MLATPIVQVLVRRTEDVELTAGVLRAFAVGLAGFSIYLYSLRPFYAEGDLRTPFRVNVAENALQVVLTIVIGLGLATAPGLALAHSIAYLVAAVGAFAVAARRLGRVPVSWVSPLVTMAFAALAMAVVVAAVLQLADLAGVDPAGAGPAGGGRRRRGADLCRLPVPVRRWRRGAGRHPAAARRAGEIGRRVRRQPTSCSRRSRRASTLPQVDRILCRVERSRRWRWPAAAVDR